MNRSCVPPAGKTHPGNLPATHGENTTFSHFIPYLNAISLAMNYIRPERVVGFNDGSMGTLISGSIAPETRPDYILAALFRSV